MTLIHGLQLPIQSQSTIYCEPWERDAGPDELVQVARACERAGFGYVGVCDHIAIPQDRAEAMSTGWYDTVATLAYVAASTSRIRLLSHIYVPAYRHPLQVAKSFATLDHLSKGRVIMGVGAGHVEGEFDLLGLDFEDRGAMLDEAIDALRHAFAAEFAIHHGERWQFEGYGQRPRPVQDPLPIWVAGSSPPALRRAARAGDGWLPQGTTLAELPGAYAVIRDERARLEREWPFTFGALCGSLYLGEPAWDVGPATYARPPEKIAGFIQKFATAGANQVQVRFRSRSVDELCDQIEAYGAEIIPAVQGSDVD